MRADNDSGGPLFSNGGLLKSIKPELNHFITIIIITHICKYFLKVEVLFLVMGGDAKKTRIFAFNNSPPPCHVTMNQGGCYKALTPSKRIAY